MWFARILLALVLIQCGEAASNEAALWRHRVLGKAYFEDPDQREKSVAELKRALELAPDSARDRINYGIALLRNSKIEDAIEQLELAKKQDASIPHIWFNLGVAYRRLNRYPEAITNYREMIRLVPSEPVPHYGLGTIYLQTGADGEAMREFQEAARLGPRLVAPHFQMLNVLRIAEREDDAAAEIAVFRKLKKELADSGETEEIEWCYYAELYDPAQSRQPDPPPGTATPLKFEERVLPAEGHLLGLAVIDFDGDGRSDLLAWSSGGVAVYRNGEIPVPGAKLQVRGVLSVAIGDFNNDGRPDLCLLTESGVVLAANRDGRFDRLPEPVSSQRFTRALWVDYDHDGDSDLLLLGASGALLRNQGTAGFTDQTSTFPFAAGVAEDIVLTRLEPDTTSFDLVVTYREHPAILYRDKLRGQYEAVPMAAVPRGAGSLHAIDFDNDGWLDLAFGAGQETILLHNRNGRLEKHRTFAMPQAPFAAADLEGRGFTDLIGPGGYLPNEAIQTGGAAKPAPFRTLAATAWAAADFTGTGKVDLAATTTDGRLHLFRNRFARKSHWLVVRLEGVKNPKFAAGSEIEVKTGSGYQKKRYDGAPVWFGVGNNSLVDAVRISWPNGMVQSATDQAVDRRASYREAPRAAGSCPMIFTWSGSQFDFVTDVLGVAPLGASSGVGEFFPVDHDEYVSIPGSMLQPKDGAYEVRITEELREVSYLDHVQLIALDHPAATTLLTNEKFHSPPFPEFRLFGVSRRSYPLTARDNTGADVRSRLLATDHTYPDQFRRDHAGVAEQHALELDFGREAAPSGDAILVLNGWVDWADGSTFLSQSQQSRDGLVMPYLQVKDATGSWKTVIAEIGIPAGKPKTIVVDLSGKFLSASRSIRIVTNLCVYWDEIYLSEQTGPPEKRLTGMELQSAELHYRGFSKPRIDPDRKQPETFDYAHTIADAPWNPIPGRYTRFGDVRELLTTIDDRLVLMGAGDEVALTFRAAGLPPLPVGWTRDFLLLVDGWAKDGDPNTAYSQSVEPLPFHGMNRYPYPEAEHFPSGPAHLRYLREYNNRPAVKGLRPLVSSTRN